MNGAHKKQFERKRYSEGGAALIISLFIVAALITLSAGFALSMVNELNSAKRHRDGAAAFWLAEAGLNQFLADTTYLNTINPRTINFGSNYVTLSKTDSTERTVTAVGRFGNFTRSLQLTFPANTPPIFQNTMSSGGNINQTGLVGIFNVFGKTRLTGNYSSGGFITSAYFQDKQTGVSSAQTTLTYPDSDGNGTADQFNDFVQFNRNLLSTYNSNEVIYVQTNGSATITPSSSLVGKKIIYVEGASAGSGNVNIIFGSTWASNQNLTIISTGNVNYIQPLIVANNSKLNTISWSSYYEPSILISQHKGVNYTHGTARYQEIFDIATSTGSTIAKNGVILEQFIAAKTFYYDSALATSAVPPGFQGLVTNAGTGYSSTPSSWKEI